MQYVSALRTPKLTLHEVNDSKSANTPTGQAGGPEESRRRVCSLTYSSSTSAHKHNLPRRSFHNQPMSGQLSCSLEEELKRRRRLAGFDQSYGELTNSDSDSDPECGETTETDEHEWKQVRDGKDVRSQWLLLLLEDVQCRASK